VEGEGNCGRFLRCPYHWWTYDLDGRLVGAPEMHGVEEFERADHGLPRLAVEVWNGFVFACHDPRAAPLAPRLERLDAWLANYGLAELVSTPVEVSEGLPFNWKLMVENGIEPYHATFLHHAMVPAPKERAYEAMPHLDGEGQIVSIVYHGFLDAALNPTYRPLLPVIETLTEDERRRFGFGTVPPNLMLGWQSDMLFWFLVCPTSVGEVTLRWSYLVPRTTAELPVFGKLLAAVRSGIEDYNAEDLPMAVSMQRGLRSRYAPRGRYSHEEEVLVQFNRWLLERYRRAT
jgi:phenylpropionate dioxygenase-like ring-hydroxylating dioxygenase large terminal subunit